MDVAALSRLLREAEEHHGRYEAIGPPHPWWDWYSAYIVAREAGRPADEAAAVAAATVERDRQ